MFPPDVIKGRKRTGKRRTSPPWESAVAFVFRGCVPPGVTTCSGTSAGVPNKPAAPRLTFLPETWHHLRLRRVLRVRWNSILWKYQYVLVAQLIPVTIKPQMLCSRPRTSTNIEPPFISSPWPHFLHMEIYLNMGNSPLVFAGTLWSFRSPEKNHTPIPERLHKSICMLNEKEYLCHKIQGRGKWKGFESSKILFRETDTTSFGYKTLEESKFLLR